MNKSSIFGIILVSSLYVLQSKAADDQQQLQQEVDSLEKTKTGWNALGGFAGIFAISSGLMATTDFLRGIITGSSSRAGRFMLGAGALTGLSIYSVGKAYETSDLIMEYYKRGAIKGRGRSEI